MLKYLQTFIIVTLVTLVIWLFAEAEGVEERSMVVDLNFVSPPNRNLLIDPTRPASNVTLTATGNSAQLSDLSEQFGRIEIELDDQPELGPVRQINLLEALRSHPALMNLGVGISEVRPTILPEVRVERYVTREVPIDVQTPTDVRHGEPNPLQAAIQLPASLADLITDETRVLAAPENDAIYGLTPNIATEMPVRLQLPPELRGLQYVTLSPATANVTLTVQRSQEIATLQVPVYVSVPPSTMGEYIVRNMENMVQVRVAGPTETIQQLRNLQLDLRAELVLNVDQLAQGVGKENTAPLNITPIPPSVTIEQPPDPMRFTVQQVELDDESSEPALPGAGVGG